jgi:hypothetical protein
MQETLVACPACHISLKLNSAAGAATKIRCPKCSAVFSRPDTADPIHQESRVEELLSQWQQRQQRGDDVTAHQLCKDCPELLPVVEPRLRLLRQMQKLAQTNDGSSAATESVVLTGDAAPPPESLGGYRVIKELGRGGMGMVYEAEDGRLKRRVALKVMLPRHAADASACRRFLREAQTQAAIEHDHIVTIYQAAEDGGVPFIAMALLKGETLADCLQRDSRLPLAEVLRIGREIAEGLAAAHERGLIHRDIKPSNLWLEGKRRRIKILDFGLARAIEESSAHLTGSGEALGTPAYMAPEQATGDAVDARTDLFGLGCVLYQMTTGTLPFAGKTMLAILNSLANTTPTPARELIVGLPAELSQLIDKLLAKEPARRPADAQTVAQTLAALEHAAVIAAATVVTPAAGVRAMPPSDAGAAVTEIIEAALSTGAAVGAVGAAPPAAPFSHAAHGDRVEVVRPSGRRRGPLIGMAVAAVVLLAVCGGGAALLYQFIIVRDKDGTEIARVKVPKDKFDIEVNGRKLVIPGPDRKPETVKPSSLLVPAYFYPADEGLKEWDRLLAASADVPILAIVNPASGPGDKVDPAYTQLLNRARDRKGLTLLGYVTSRYAKRAAAEVQADIDRWRRLYPQVHGVFLDQQASGADQVDYYAGVRAYARQEGKFTVVVTNPGTVCAEAYFARPATDVACLLETGDGVATFQPPAWAKIYASTRFAVLQHQVRDAGQMRLCIENAMLHGIGNMYVTDAGGANPYERLPVYWEAEVAAVKKLNSRSQP